MNDEELIKCLVKSSELKCSQCFQYYECNSDDCEKVIAEKALDLINRQQAEIEKLKNEIKEADQLFSKGFLHKGLAIVARLAKEIERGGENEKSN